MRSEEDCMKKTDFEGYLIDIREPGFEPFIERKKVMMQPFA